MENIAIGRNFLQVDDNNRLTLTAGSEACLVKVALDDPLTPDHIVQLMRAIHPARRELANSVCVDTCSLAASRLLENMPSFTENSNTSPALLKLFLTEALCQLLYNKTVYGAHVETAPEPVPSPNGATDENGEPVMVMAYDVDDYDYEEEMCEDEDGYFF